MEADREGFDTYSMALFFGVGIGVCQRLRKKKNCAKMCKNFFIIFMIICVILWPNKTMKFQTIILFLFFVLFALTILQYVPQQKRSNPMYILIQMQ